MKINDFSLLVATANGSGSQSSNLVLTKAFFRMGLPVGSKNLFPSNIAGLPTWFSIRVNPEAQLSRQNQADLIVAMNKDSFEKDLQQARPGAVFLYNQDLKIDPEGLRQDLQCLALPCREILKPVTDSVRLKKLLTNMCYAGAVGQLLGVDKFLLNEVVADQFRTKPGVIEVNQQALSAGFDYAAENFAATPIDFKAEPIEAGNSGKILIDGNSAAALGLLAGGCSFMSWYPITPSSSVAEKFEELSTKYRKDSSGASRTAVVQAEDELGAISMVLGAGWAGARAVTATSGPGLSLMAEAAGLSYFSEVPAVIWNVQRVGPSTGLPTRTSQGDLLSAFRLSHGDTEHVVLLPGNVQECYEFGRIALDLADRLQSLVIVLSDLDLGMNLWRSDSFQLQTKNYDRGKVRSREDLEAGTEFQRYRDVDGDAICYRTLPGTDHPKAAFFTRGTGHDESSAYSEDPKHFEALLDRLQRKMQTARQFVPEPVVDINPEASVGLVAFGSTDSVVSEVRHRLLQQGQSTSYLRLRALPFTQAVEDFLQQHQQIVVVEQNRDGQLMSLIKENYPQYWKRLKSVRHYDGLPIDAQSVSTKMNEVFQ